MAVATSSALCEESESFWRPKPDSSDTDNGPTDPPPREFGDPCEGPQLDSDIDSEMCVFSTLSTSPAADCDSSRAAVGKTTSGNKVVSYNTFAKQSKQHINKDLRTLAGLSQLLRFSTLCSRTSNASNFASTLLDRLCISCESRAISVVQKEQTENRYTKNVKQHACQTTFCLGLAPNTSKLTIPSNTSRFSAICHRTKGFQSDSKDKSQAKTSVSRSFSTRSISICNNPETNCSPILT
jgi:hypothetical protein